MFSRSSIFSVFLVFISFIVMGCSGSGSSVLSPGVGDEQELASAQSSGTGDTLASLSGTMLPNADVYLDDQLVTSADENGNYELSIPSGDHLLSFGYGDFIVYEKTVNGDSRTVACNPPPPPPGGGDPPLPPPGGGDPPPPPPPPPDGGDPPPPPPPPPGGGDPPPPPDNPPLPPDMETGSVQGIVYAIPLQTPEGDYLPLEGAVVVVVDRDKHYFAADVTDEQGAYLIEEAPAGDVHIAVFARGYQPLAEPVTIVADTMLVKDFNLKIAKHLGHLIGYVRDENFSPLADVAITLTNPLDPAFIVEKKTEMCGLFMINKLRPGDYNLKAELEGYETFEKTITIRPGRNFVKIKLVLVE
jgi:hypothetical protein